MDDKQLKEQMEKLDTLSAGIVYGREEAWDKLQARMERRPARKIWLDYRKVAAAAMLLLSAGIGLYLYTTTAVTIRHANTYTSLHAVSNTTVVPLVSKQTATTVVVVDKAAKTTKQSRHRIPATGGEQFATQAIIATAQPSVILKPVQTTSRIAVTATVATKPMNIVHLNELHNSIKKQKALPTATVAIAGNDAIPVVHINDVIHAGQEEHRILKENRLSISHLPFINAHIGDEPAYNTTDIPSYPHSFQIKITSQN